MTFDTNKSDESVDIDWQKSMQEAYTLINKLDKTVTQQDEELKHWHSVVAGLLNSFSWRITRPLRDFRQLLSRKGPAADIRFYATNSKPDEETELRLFQINRTEDRLNSSEFTNGKLILLIGHEASRTGAPMVALQIAHHFKVAGFTPLIILPKGGELELEFEKEFVTVRLLEAREHALRSAMDFLFKENKIPKPRLAMFNSAETGWAIDHVQPFCSNIVFLIHEIMDSYSTGYAASIVDRSQVVVFPANFVKERAERRISRAINHSQVIPSALVDQNFFEEPKEDCRQLIRRQLRIPQNSKIVLACGTSDLRKGFDLFTQIALASNHFYSNNAGEMHFVWIGVGDIYPNSTNYFQTWDRHQSNYTNSIHFLKSTPDIKPFFYGADVFILPSRQDPFPGVVHNAMAAKLPVVAFQNAGGVSEMLLEGGGTCVPYGDVMEMGKQIANLLNNESDRLSIGESGYNSVRKNFQFSGYFSKLLEISNLLIDRVEK